jgi:hypothetical protein
MEREVSRSAQRKALFILFFGSGNRTEYCVVCEAILLQTSSMISHLELYADVGGSSGDALDL